MFYQRFIQLMLVCLVVQGCSNCRVAVPSPEKDCFPAITISARDNKQGQYTHDYTSDATINVDNNTVLKFYATAFNSCGGIKELSLTVSYSSSGFTQTYPPAVGTLDANNLAPKQIVLMPDKKLIPVSISAVNFPLTITVRATATNFNGQQSTVTLTYNVNPPPVALTFTLSPANEPGGEAYVPVGSKVTLSWSVKWCISPCHLTLQAFGGLNYSHLIINDPNLPPSGSFVVQPGETNTKYVITASGANGTDSKTHKIDLAPLPNNYSCTYFFFKMTSNSSVILPCFGQAICAKDEESAKIIAESLNGGYSATAITESEFTAGCH